MSEQTHEFARIASDVTLGRNVRLNAFINLYGCRIGDNAMIGTIGHGVMFINDRHPSIATTLANPWKMERTTVKCGASIGSGALIFGGITIGEDAVIGAGAVGLKDVAAGTTVTGVPARLIKERV